MPGLSLIDHFAALEGPRQSWKVLFPLPEVLLVVLCGTLAGAGDFVEIRRWGQDARARDRQLAMLWSVEIGCCHRASVGGADGRAKAQVLAD